jgi:hypothetical protein
LATASVPTIALVPGRFSSTMFCRSSSDSLAMVCRAVMSAPEPAEYGTITRIGRLG